MIRRTVSGKIYSITSKLDRTMPDEVLFDAVEMMERLMGTEDVAIYNVVNGDYARMFSASSKKARELGNSIRYKEMSVMYDALKEHRVLSINPWIRSIRLWQTPSLKMKRCR